MVRKISVSFCVCLIIALSSVTVQSASVPEVFDDLNVPIVADPESKSANPEAVPATVVIVNDIRKFLRENPNVVAEPMQRVQDRANPQQRGQIRYTLGARVNGDRLVALNSDSRSWPTLQNVELTLTYPQSGLGNIVSYVEITVSQSSNLGQGYVVSGGIGLRWITVVIEAYNTYNFSYTSYIYGY